MNKKITLSVMTVMMLTTMGMADEVKVADVEAQYSAKSTVEASDELKQSINLGFSSTTGNTDTLNLNGKYTAAYTTVGYADQALKVGFDASAFVTKNNDVKDNEEYVANLGLEQYITDGWLGYASLNWLRNEFRNFDNKFSVGAGVGKEIFNDGQHSLKVKLGVAYNIEQYSNGQADHKYTSLNEYLEYNNKLNDVSNLYVKVGASQNFDDFGDYEVLAVAGLNFAVAENLSVTIEEEVRYDKIAPLGFDTTDTKTIVRVGYNF
jgi:putative salt-induced outer membrane protein YdiY